MEANLPGHGVQADLMGTVKEGHRDGRRRARLHAEWAQQQDQANIAAVMAGLQHGWRKPGGNAFEDDDVEVRTHISDPVFTAFGNPVHPSPAHGLIQIPSFYMKGTCFTTPLGINLKDTLYFRTLYSMRFNIQLYFRGHQPTWDYGAM